MGEQLCVLAAGSLPFESQFRALSADGRTLFAVGRHSAVVLCVYCARRRTPEGAFHGGARVQFCIRVTRDAGVRRVGVEYVPHAKQVVAFVCTDHDVCVLWPFHTPSPVVALVQTESRLATTVFSADWSSFAFTNRTRASADVYKVDHVRRVVEYVRSVRLDDPKHPAHMFAVSAEHLLIGTMIDDDVHEAVLAGEQAPADDDSETEEDARRWPAAGAPTILDKRTYATQVAAVACRVPAKAMGAASSSGGLFVSARSVPMNAEQKAGPVTVRVCIQSRGGARAGTFTLTKRYAIPVAHPFTVDGVRVCDAVVRGAVFLYGAAGVCVLWLDDGCVRASAFVHVDGKAWGVAYSPLLNTLAVSGTRGIDVFRLSFGQCLAKYVGSLPIGIRVYYASENELMVGTMDGSDMGVVRLASAAQEHGSDDDESVWQLLPCATVSTPRKRAHSDGAEESASKCVATHGSDDFSSNTSTSCRPWTSLTRSPSNDSASRSRSASAAARPHSDVFDF